MRAYATHSGASVCTKYFVKNDVVLWTSSGQLSSFISFVLPQGLNSFSTTTSGLSVGVGVMPQDKTRWVYSLTMPCPQPR